MRQGDQASLGHDGPANVVRINRAAAVRLHARERNPPIKLHLPQGPTNAVMLEIAGDDMIAFGKHSLKRHVECVGAVQREDKSFGSLAMEKLIEEMPGIIQGALCRQGHLVPCPAWIGEILAGETVEGLVDRLGLGKTGSGVVEVDHLKLAL